MIAEDWAGKIRYLNTDLTADLAEICFSHNRSYTQLLTMETMKLCEEDTYLCVPFVAVILRLADIIDFDPKRTPPMLFSHLSIENPISLKEWRKHLAISAWSITPKSLIYSAQCSHPAIESSIRKFCDLIDNELRNCTTVLASLNCDFVDDINYYKIPLPACVDRRKITAKIDIVTGKPIYNYHDTKFTLSKKQVTDLLMGTKLYGKPEVALRELIQNSIDACRLREKLCNKWKERYDPKITISFYSIDNIDYLKVSDNGIGMNQHIIDNYYTNIGNSYYKSSEFYELMDESGGLFKPISKFGIGILSCFMVCDHMMVNTRRVIGQYQYDVPLKITIEGYDSLFIINDGDRKEPGTDTTLKLRKNHPWRRIDKTEIIKTIKRLIPLPPFDILIELNEVNETCSSDDFDKLDLEFDSDSYDRDFYRYRWEEDDDIEIISINLNSLDKDFRGKASIAIIIDSNGTPTYKLNMGSKNVFIEGKSYSLSSSIKYGIDCIEKFTSSLEIDDTGSIHDVEGISEINNSFSLLSIHGINLPCYLFYDYRYDEGKCILHFPFPIKFRLDIGVTNDINLNTSRTQIIYDELWLKLEKDLFEVVCCKIKESINSDMWDNIKEIFLKEIKYPELYSILKDI